MKKQNKTLLLDSCPNDPISHSAETLPPAGASVPRLLLADSHWSGDWSARGQAWTRTHDRADVTSSVLRKMKACFLRPCAAKGVLCSGRLISCLALLWTSLCLWATCLASQLPHLQRIIIFLPDRRWTLSPRFFHVFLLLEGPLILQAI